MTVRRGIVGIAGIDGNGQIELAQTIMGLQKVELGHVDSILQTSLNLIILRASN